ncbi:TIM barrel protein [Chryseolinea sp. H1M3-3]|uniref:sugar phosphate isomerase/epimerase family protein n=1 Tax=Chryseolinea sp. H1M3-3 TaxID=3034144 RepID=UPI0023EC1008|nr:TIM barrel protein [Chryseolinea sp. H1M3-3]
MSGTAAAMMNPLESFNKPLTTSSPSAGFELIMLATNWGYGGSWEEFCAKIKDDGYDGAEVWYPEEEKSRKEFLDAVHKYNLKFAFLFGGSDRDYARHLQQFKSALEQAAALKPLFINSHSGRDHFNFEQNKSFIDFTAELNAKTKVPIYHETHRGRILYSAPVGRQFMEAHPTLRLTLDISHWCNVHESLLEDQSETVKLALSRTDHIHTRIGHAEGPQVNDPRAPEWKDAVNAHMGWWDQVVEQKRREGKRITMLTEFGPVDYLPALPYTRQPVANQWDINKYMLDTLRKRYAK